MTKMNLVTLEITTWGGWETTMQTLVIISVEIFHINVIDWELG